MNADAGLPTLRPWTAWCDYYATGEGRSIMGCITLARDEVEARRAFAQAFGEGWAQYCTVAPGAITNECTAFLWSTAGMNNIQRAADTGCIVHAHSQIRINCS